jgi:hypothetical protein
MCAMDDLILYGYAAAAVLCLGIALLVTAVVAGIWIILAALFSGTTNTLPGTVLSISLLLAGYCVAGLLLRQLGIT